MAKIKIEQPRGPFTIVFCLPGRSYSGSFLKGWSETLQACLLNGIRPLISQDYDPVVYYARNKVLGGDVRRGVNQKPFDGKVPYDYLMWIDDDIVFTFDQIKQLLNRKLDVVAGLYMMSDQKHFAAVQNWDEQYYIQNGSFQFMTEEDIQGKQDPMPVAYSGFGFMLMKHGVIESLQYPWFNPITYEFNVGGVQIKDFSSEDTSICRMLTEKGIPVHIDPTVRVGHLKSIVL